MMIHSIILERRRELGLTQEQVAACLGVTAPAVNKWEKGSTCPDIALLPPLARLLKIDLNTLFGFCEDVTQQELVQFCIEIREAFLSGNFESGFEAAQRRIREYPHSDALLHNAALQLQGLLTAMGPDADPNGNYRRQIDAWLVQLTRSKDPTIRNSACLMLASRAIVDADYEQAQEYLDQIPDRSEIPDKQMLQATVYLDQNRTKEAAALLEHTLLTAINSAQTALLKLIDANIASGDVQAAAHMAEKATLLAEAFDLSDYNAAIGPFQIAVANKDAGQAAALLRRMLKSMVATWKIQESPLYRHAAPDSPGASMEKLIGPLLDKLKGDPEYAWLHPDEEFQALLAEYGGKASPE